jgi:broad specificity phosphatase PhoE/ribonuclease HI
VSSAGRLAVVVEADGGSRGNPGPAGYGAVVFAADGRTVLAERKDAIGIATNNVAEYQGLIAGLRAAAELGAVEVRVRMDSNLVVQQMSGSWQVKHPAMVPLNRQAVQLARGFERISYEWIPRAKNSHADRLANEAMDGFVGAAPVELDAVPDASEPANNNSAWVSSNAKPTRFVLVRHGVTEYSLAKRFAGRSDLALTALGAEQAAQAAERVATFGPVDALVCSPLLRTRQTASALSDRLGIEPVLDEGMIELNYGDWDGYTFDEIRQNSPGELQRWLADPAVAPPSGESLTQLTQRVRRSRDRLLAAHEGKTVVVVTHVSPIKCLVQLALDAPPAAVHRMFLAPASVSVIDYFADGPVSLRSYNDTAHLSGG